MDRKGGNRPTRQKVGNRKEEPTHTHATHTHTHTHTHTQGDKERGREDDKRYGLTGRKQ